jgi:amino acid adenylation domain-containing protein
MASIAGWDKQKVSAAAEPAGTQPTIALSSFLASKNAGPAQLSFAQERLWFLDQISPGEVSSSLAAAVRLSGVLDVDALQNAVDTIVARHDILRATFARNELDAGVNGRPIQLIKSTQFLPLHRIDLSATAEAGREQKAREIAMAEAQRPFDLMLGPLLRLTLLKFSDREFVLLLGTHGIVSDEFSLQLFFAELWSAYGADLAAPAPERRLQFIDYAEWQRDRQDGLESDLGFWEGMLDGAPAVIDLPLDGTRPAVQTWHGGVVATLLPQPLAGELRVVAARLGTDLFAVLLTALEILLARYSQQSDLVIGVVLPEERNAETRNLIGPVGGALPLRTDLSGNLVVGDLIASVADKLSQMQEHRAVPFEKLLEKLRVERSLSHAPVFQVLFNLQQAPEASVINAGLKCEPFSFETGVTRFDLVLKVIEDSKGLTCRLEFNTDLFASSTASRMLGHFCRLLAGVAADPQQTIAQLPLLTVAEQTQTLQDWNDTRKVLAHASVLDLFAAQVARTPGAMAVEFGEQQLTYSEFDARANQLAQYLVALGVSPDARVGICIDRGLDMAVGVLGVLKAGAAYVPLDPAYPAERLSFMLADSQCAVLLTNEATRERIAATLSGTIVKVVCLDRDWPEVARAIGDGPAPEIFGDNLAYIIYTSGSTGWPKGVAMTHRALNNVISWQLDDLPRPARTLQFASLSFDVSFQEMFSTWCSGGTLLLVSDELRRDATSMLHYLREQKAERMFLPFVYLQHLAEAFTSGGNAPQTMQQIITAGEQLEITPQIARLFAAMPDCSLHNHYGPSETHVVTAYTLPPLRSEWQTLPPIGRPVANTQIYILDRHQQPTPVGVAGELWLGGVNVSRGYLNRPELTAEKFVPDPFSLEPGARVYRTGDLARYLPDGNIEFLGRIDNQVKIRGFRIELGEIEATLRTHAAVSDAVVVPRKGSDALAAFIVVERSRNENEGALSSELRSHLAARLPDYMVPAIFIEVARLPQTPSGKIDRRALKVPDEYHLDAGQDHIAPRDEVEENLARVWEQVLGLKAVGVRDNFFELGGHSLLAARLFAQIENRFGANLPLATLFQAPTIEQLAEILRAGDSKKEWSSLVPIQSQGSRPALFCVHAAGANVLIYRPLARHLGLDQPVYAFQARGLDGQSEPYVSVAAMAAHYLKEMRAFQPEGPYYLLGASFGGLVAFEMAQRLLAQGQDVALLALLNTNCPVYSLAKRIGCHLGHLKQRGAGPYLRSAVNAVRGRIGKATIPSETAVPDRGLQEAIESKADQSDPLVRTVLANLHAENEYAPANKIYPGKIALFWARDAEQDFEDNRLAWRKVAAGCTVHEVPGNHTTMREEPHIGVLVDELRGYLSQRSEGRRRKSEI